MNWIFWLVLLLIIVLVCVGLYFFPKVTVKVLSGVIKIITLGLFAVIKGISKGFSSMMRKSRKPFKRNLIKKKLELDDSTQNIVINNSEVFIEKE